MSASIPNPRHVVLITARGNAKILGKTTEKDNVMTIDWHMQISKEPLMWAIAVGKTRFTSNLINNSKCFCINFMPYAMKEKTLKAGSTSGELKDKFKELGLEKEECEKIDCPRIKGSTGFLECQVAQVIEAGDHYIYIANVLFQETRDDKRLIHISGDKFTTTMN